MGCCRPAPSPHRRPSALHCARSGSESGASAGDIVVFMSVLASVHRPWVARLLTPYTVCFGISMLVSFVSFMSKSELRIVPHQLARLVRLGHSRRVASLCSEFFNHLPALVMLTFLVGKFRSQNWRLGMLDDDDRNLQQALDANRFAARCAAHRCFPPLGCKHVVFDVLGSVAQL